MCALQVEYTCSKEKRWRIGTQSREFLRVSEVLTLVFLVDLNVDRVDALLDVVPGEELLPAGEGVGSEADECVCVPEVEEAGQGGAVTIQ